MTTLTGILGSRLLLLTLVAALPLAATTIDFEAEAVHRGGDLTGTPDSPFTVGIATFTGGELLRGEVGLNADATGVYASEGLFGSGETNPLTITFAVPVQNLSVLVLNGDDARNYTVWGNTGESVTESLASAGALGAAVFTLPGSDLTAVAITSANADAWDFAIDNVSFTQATPTPEPASLVLSAVALALLGALRPKQLGQ